MGESFCMDDMSRDRDVISSIVEETSEEFRQVVQFHIE